MRTHLFLVELASPHHSRDPVAPSFELNEVELAGVDTPLLCPMEHVCDEELLIETGRSPDRDPLRRAQTFARAEQSAVERPEIRRVVLARNETLPVCPAQVAPLIEVIAMRRRPARDDIEIDDESLRWPRTKRTPEYSGGRVPKNDVN